MNIFYAEISEHADGERRGPCADLELPIDESHRDLSDATLGCLIALCVRHRHGWLINIMLIKTIRARAETFHEINFAAFMKVIKHLNVDPPFINITTAATATTQRQA